MLFIEKEIIKLINKQVRSDEAGHLSQLKCTPVQPQIEEEEEEKKKIENAIEGAKESSSTWEAETASLHH